MRLSPLSCIAAIALAGWSPAQSTAQPPPPVNRQGASAAQVEVPGSAQFVKPSPPLIGDVPADQLSADQLRAFLQSKIRSIVHSTESVEILRVSPGYPVTLSLPSPPMDVIVGDPHLITSAPVGRLLVLSAGASSGDTSMKISLAGDRLLNFHIFVEPTFVTSDSTVEVFLDDEFNEGREREVSPSFATIATVIRNYDALVQEGALNPLDVVRAPVIQRREEQTRFAYFHWFTFRRSTSALTFSYTHSGPGPRHIEADQLRLVIGNSLFKPILVSFSSNILAAGETATGFAAFKDPPFKLDQPFELAFR